MKGKMHGKKLEAAKMHYDQLMQVLSALGMSLEDFQEQMEGEEMGMEEMEEEEGEEMEKAGPDMGKVSMIVAKLRAKKPSEEEEEEA